MDPLSLSCGHLCCTDITNKVCLRCCVSFCAHGNSPVRIMLPSLFGKKKSGQWSVSLFILTAWQDQVTVQGSEVHSTGWGNSSCLTLQSTETLSL